MSDTESYTESEPEQFPEEVKVTPEATVTKLEKPKRKLTEKQLKALADAREKRRINRAASQEVPAQEATQEATQVVPTQEAAQEASNKKKALSKMNKKELQEEAQRLNIDIEGLNNEQIKKKLRGASQPEEVIAKTIEPTKKSKVIKEVHHHHYGNQSNEEEPPKEVKQIKSKSKKVVPNMTVKKENQIINFV